MENGVYETRANRIWLGEDGILRVVNHPGVEITLRDAKESHAATLKITEGRRVPILVDMRHTKGITREARDFYSGQEMKTVVVARALLVDSAISRVIGNFFLGLNKPSDPARLFTSESEALEWLKGFIE